MARRKMSEGKKNVIAMLLQEYDVHTATDLEDALKDLMGGTIESMLDNHHGYKEYERSENEDYRNGTKSEGNLVKPLMIFMALKPVRE